MSTPIAKGRSSFTTFSGMPSHLAVQVWSAQLWGLNVDISPARLAIFKKLGVITDFCLLHDPTLQRRKLRPGALDNVLMSTAVSGRAGIGISIFLDLRPTFWPTLRRFPQRLECAHRFASSRIPWGFRYSISQADHSSELVSQPVVSKMVTVSVSLSRTLGHQALSIHLFVSAPVGSGVSQRLITFS